MNCDYKIVIRDISERDMEELSRKIDKVLEEYQHKTSKDWAGESVIQIRVETHYCI